MEAAHGGEVVGEGFGVSGLQLLNQELDVGGDEFLFGVGLLAVGGDGGGCAAHGVFSFAVVWLLHVRVETRHVHAERLLAKAGVARRRGGVSPPLERSEGGRKGRSAAEVCTSEARKIGEPLRRAIGAEPLSEVCLRYWRAYSTRNRLGGVAGGMSR